MKKLLGLFVVLVAIVGITAIMAPPAEARGVIFDVRECALLKGGCCRAWAEGQCPPTDTMCVQLATYDCLYGMVGKSATDTGQQILYTPSNQAAPVTLDNPKIVGSQNPKKK